MKHKQRCKHTEAANKAKGNESQLEGATAQKAHVKQRKKREKTTSVKGAGISCTRTSVRELRRKG